MTCWEIQNHEARGWEKRFQTDIEKLSSGTYSTMIWPSMKKYGEIMEFTKMDESIALVYDGIGMRRR